MAEVTAAQPGAAVIHVALAGSDGTPGGGGGFVTTSVDLQTVIERHLPTSTVALRAEVAERVGVEPEEYAHADFVTCLLHLADFETGARMNEEHAQRIEALRAEVAEAVTS